MTAAGDADMTYNTYVCVFVCYSSQGSLLMQTHCARFRRIQSMPVADTANVTVIKQCGLVSVKRT